MTSAAIRCRPATAAVSITCTNNYTNIILQSIRLYRFAGRVFHGDLPINSAFWLSLADPGRTRPLPVIKRLSTQLIPGRRRIRLIRRVNFQERGNAEHKLSDLWTNLMGGNALFRGVWPGWNRWGGGKGGAEGRRQSSKTISQIWILSHRWWGSRRR